MSETMAESNAALWIMSPIDPIDGDVIVESAGAHIMGERTDDDEVAIHAILDGYDQAVVTVYMTRARAALLAAQLSALAVTDAA